MAAEPRYPGAADPHGGRTRLCRLGAVPLRITVPLQRGRPRCRQAGNRGADPSRTPDRRGRMMNEREFVQAAKTYGIDLTEEMCAQFRKYTEILLSWNERMNLTAITDPEEIYEKHFLDSLSLLCLEGIRGRIADVGSGAGFPGLVLAIVLPEAELCLIDPMAKRCTFLRTAAEELGLHNVTVFNARAEDHAKEYRET
ncbi:MAG: 16S rRNA (guanine(527)-N(7))-methyltransferase RsmG [Erysipelotrichaceae bacterium]|nr:16S rRNA (guanine(527)-N(7))-methyltransferase RsmG [Erysipelotrichaceae bacterium]